MTPSRLETDRLVLTAIAEADFADLCQLTAHPDVGGKLKHGVLTEVETRAQLDGYRTTWERAGYGVFAIRRREDAAFVGVIGLWDHDEGVGVALRYAVMPDHRSHGYTKEAANSVLHFAAAQNIHPVMAVTRENNLVSQRILVDLGFALREIRDTGHARLAVYQQATGRPA
ncbi:MAG: GNAT family N-acetyltransferase [Phreatobacter sp.]|uniref:GNAT family N-acetyltransferase n=1 Tax=Phreatobacter sp. TaxID=1966341 RepID=UPI002735A682|nr:GNAT family N-acetyltransferase [Phreatobacter sp.]MDP2804083.1 GNAT family N-acetyltransferase [Phreatobacter sp.]